MQMGMWRAATQEVLFARPLAEAEAIGFVDDEWRWFPLTVEVRHGLHAPAQCICLYVAAVAGRLCGGCSTRTRVLRASVYAHASVHGSLAGGGLDCCGP